MVKMYMGPSIQGTMLRESMILRGTEEDILLFTEEARKRHPEIVHLLAEPEEATEKKKQILTKGNLLNKYYNDVLSKERASKQGG